VPGLGGTIAGGDGGQEQGHVWEFGNVHVFQPRDGSITATVVVAVAVHSQQHEGPVVYKPVGAYFGACDFAWPQAFHWIDKDLARDEVSKGHVKPKPLHPIDLLDFHLCCHLSKDK
jgi:hypothetical protein